MSFIDNFSAANLTRLSALFIYHVTLLFFLNFFHHLLFYKFVCSINQAVSFACKTWDIHSFLSHFSRCLSLLWKRGLFKHWRDFFKHWRDLFMVLSFDVFRRVWRCDESENSLQQKGHCSGPDVGSAGRPDGWVRLWTVRKTSRIFSILLFIKWLICFCSANFTAALHLDRARLFGKQLRVTRTYFGHFFPLCSNLFVYLFFFLNFLGCLYAFNWCMFLLVCGSEQA